MSSAPRNAGHSLAADGGTGELLVRALETRVPGARTHADATASYAFAVAAELGLRREECVRVREAARLHEIGRLYVDDGAHAEAGYRLALGAGIPEQLCEWILNSGNRFDGGAQLPVESRVIAAACEYHALQGEGGDAGGAGRRALIGVAELAGGRLDPIAVDALARVVERAAGAVRA
jgi:HD-GYP domain-containing protein (c-di-GMP phosphodiesterase class II)